jgi:hypothetical protein
MKTHAGITIRYMLIVPCRPSIIACRDLPAIAISGPSHVPDPAHRNASEPVLGDGCGPARHRLLLRVEAACLALRSPDLYAMREAAPGPLLPRARAAVCPQPAKADAAVTQSGACRQLAVACYWHADGVGTCWVVDTPLLVAAASSVALVAAISGWVYLSHASSKSVLA